MTAPPPGRPRQPRAARRARRARPRRPPFDERLRFARDLHDLLGHSLSLIALKTELARKLVERDAARAAAASSTTSSTRHANARWAEVREAVQGYRRLALADALESAQVALAAAGIDCELRRRADVLAPRRRRRRFRRGRSREGTTNVIRHSGAHHCEIPRSRRRGSRRRLEIEDERTAPPRGDGSQEARAATAGKLVHASGGELEAALRPGYLFRLPTHRPAGRVHVIRVLIAEDQAMVRGALASLLRLEKDIDVVAEVERGDQVVASPAQRARPDVALLDIEMPGLDGIAVAGELAGVLPQTRSLILTTFGRPVYAARP